MSASTQSSLTQPSSDAQLFERGPDWSKALVEWGLFWDIHNIVYGSIFSMISLYIIRCAYVTWRRQIEKRTPQNLQNLIMFLLCASRAFVLFADPYLQGTLFTQHTFMKLLWYLGEPGLVSIHCLLIMIVATDYTPNTLLKKLSFAFMITHYVVVTVIVPVAESYPTETQLVLIFRQILFLVWGYFIGVNVVRLASILWRKFKEESTSRGRFLVNWIYACGLSYLMLLGLHAYITMTEIIHYIYPNTGYTGAWKWLATQTAMRLFEIISCELVLTVLAKRHALAAYREETHEYEGSPGISISEDFYDFASCGSFHSVVFTGPANEQPTVKGFTNTEPPFSNMLSNQSRGYCDQDSGSAHSYDSAKTDPSQEDVNQDDKSAKEKDNHDLISQIEKQIFEKRRNKAELYQVIDETAGIPEHTKNEEEDTDNDS